LIILSASLRSTVGPSLYNLQVGAFGDPNSVNNLGVRAEIRTHTYAVDRGDADSFWIGDRLQAGAFIQFGYILLSAGSYCGNATMESGSVLSCGGRSLTVNGSQPAWFWTYFPGMNESKFDYGLGLSQVLASNGTWHLYSIHPSKLRTWVLELDGQNIATLNVLPINSRDTPTLVAEKATQSATPGPLGPVEFRNLSYLEPDGWHSVKALYAIVNCGANPNCIPIPYGVSLIGPNHIIAGTAVSQPPDGSLLWGNPATLNATSVASSNVLIPSVSGDVSGVLAISVVATLLAVTFLLIPRRKKIKR